MTPEQKISKLQADSKKEISKITKDISKVMILPEEEPSLFEIKDPDMLAKQQSFFVGAKVGDKLLVYALVGKAIIWSPSRNMIVNVGPISSDNNIK